MKTETTTTGIDSRHWIALGMQERARKHTDALLRRVDKKGLTGICIAWAPDPTFRVRPWSNDPDAEITEYATAAEAQAVADRENLKRWPKGVADCAARGCIRSWQTVVEGHWVRVWGGAPPSLEGWTLAARVTHLTDAETGEPVNVFDPVPGVEIPEEFRNRDRVCDHCKARRLRKYTFVCRNETTGEWVQVGSTCLRDFLGVDPSFVLRWYAFFDRNEMASFYSDGDEDNRASIREVPWTDLDEVLLWCAYTVLTSKYVSAGQARDSFDLVPTWSAAQSTRAFINNPIIGHDRDGRLRAEKKRIRQWIQDNEALLAERIEYAKQWVRGLPGHSTFDNNQKAILAARQVTYRHWGHVAFWVAKARHESQELARQERAAGIEQATADAAARRAAISEAQARRERSQHFGEPLVRQPLEGVEVLSKRTYDGEYGEGSIVKMRHGDNLIVWFAGRAPAEKLVVGGVYDVKLTVKKHNTHERFGRETQVNRVAVTRVVSAPKQEEPTHV